MKAKFLALAALILGMVSCQNDFDGANVGKKGEVDFTLSVAVPEMETRAAGGDSAVGGLQNIDLENAFDIRYILEVYDANGALAKERMYSFEDTAANTTFNLRLVPGRPYTFVVWADFVPEIQGERDLAADYDNHYETSEGLTAVQVIENKWTTIDESRDAYTGKHYEADFRSTSTINVTLTRPFAKLRVVTTDIKELYGNLMPETVTVNYLNTYFYNQFNALTQDVVGEPAAADPKVVDLSTMTYTGEDPKCNGKMTLFADYFFRATDDRVMFTMDVVDNTDQEIPTVVFNTNIPVQRNYLTTVMGPILTDSNNITVTIDDAFEGYHNIGGNVVTTNEELKAALTQNVENISVVLGADLTYDIAAWDKFKMGGDKTKTITISGVQPEPETLTRAAAAGAYTLTFNFTNSDWCNVVTDATLVLKDLNIKTSGYNTGAWNTAHLNFNCNVEMYNVTSTIVNFEKNAIVKNLKVNGVGGQYAIWVTAEGQTVSIDGLTVNAAEGGSRGIKIGDQYVDSPAKVTLNIKNAKFNTAEKAAILVSSKAGADINLEDVNIENVAADPVNAVWVDEDWYNYADKVTVTGGTCIVEGSTWDGESTKNPEANSEGVYVINSAEKLAGFAKAVNEGKLKNINVELGANIDLNNKAWTPIGLNADNSNRFYGTFDGKGFTIKNLNVDTEAGYTAAGFFGSLNGTAKNFTIENANIKHISTGGATDNGIAVVAGSIYTKGNIENVTVKNAHVEGNRYMGGIAGYVYGNIKDCKVIGIELIATPNEVSAGNYDNGDKVGGIAGGFWHESVYTISGNSVENFTIVGYRDLGGIVGAAQSKTVVNNTAKNGSVTINQGVGFYGKKDYNAAEVVGRLLNSEELPASNSFENVTVNAPAEPTYDEATKTYGVDSAAEMVYLIDAINAGDSMSGKTIKLEADIDMKGGEWTPIGQTGGNGVKTYFQGTFDGNGKTIKNFVITKSHDGEHYATGMFGFIDAAGASIKNLNVENAEVHGHHWTGVIVGYLTGEISNCTVTNCHVYCTHANADACGDKAGAVVGYVNGTQGKVDNCHAVDCTVTAGRDGGQVVGAAYDGQVVNCTATNVTVSATGDCTDGSAGKNIRNEIVGRVL